MKRILLALVLLAVPVSALAQSNVRIVGRGSDGIDRPVLTTLDGKLQVDGAAGGGSTSTGTPGGTAPTSATQVAGRSAAGNLVVACTSTLGVLCSPVAGTANRVITKTAVSATTSTTICPAATVPVTTEIQVSSANVGIGVNGQTLTAAALGVTTADPDLVLPTALTLYVFPVAPTNIITAYAASAFIATCIQTIRT